MNYQVNEIFASIQGEAAFAGRPCVFIRLQGCGVGCPWCDTKDTWDASEGSQLSIDEIVQTVFNLMPRCAHVVLTGGEPLEQDIIPLVKALQNMKLYVQIETSGTAIIPEHIRTTCWVTLSPKIGMKKPFIVQNLKRCREIKFCIGKESDIEKLTTLLTDGPYPGIYLQPLSMNPKSTKACVDLAMAHGYAVSVQTHKYLGLP